MAKKKRSTALIVSLLVLCLFAGFILQSSFGFFTKMLAGVNLQGFNLFGGLEGAHCQLVGATPFGTDWTGNNLYSPVRQGTNLLSHGIIGAGDNVYWANYDPNNQLIYWDYDNTFGHDRLKFFVETQKDVPLNNLNYMGDPLNWSEQQYFEIVQYQPNASSMDDDPNRQLEKVTNPDGTTSYTLTKRSFLIVPAELHLTLSIPASQERSIHDSGWEEGDWMGLQLWFKLDFTSWNSQGLTWSSSDDSPEWDAAYYKDNPASSTAKNLASDFSTGGGFPVSAWIQGFLLNLDPTTTTWDSTWFKKQSGGYYAAGSNAKLNAKTSVVPSLLGHYFSLYNTPGVQSGESVVPVIKDKSLVEATAKTSPWIEASQIPQYFSVTVNSFGTLTEGGWPGGYDIYYPAVNYRIRLLYVIWGTFTYLWTVKSAQDNGYPGWQDRTSETVHVSTWWEGFLGLLSNPWFLFFFGGFMILIMLVLMAVFAPGILMVVSSLGKRAASAIEPKSKAGKAG